MSEPMARALASLIAAVLCFSLMHMTKGTHGIGWFIFALFIVWSN